MRTLAGQHQNRAFGRASAHAAVRHRLPAASANGSGPAATASVPCQRRGSANPGTGSAGAASVTASLARASASLVKLNGGAEKVSGAEATASGGEGKESGAVATWKADEATETVTP